jgi:hypothetical protein
MLRAIVAMVRHVLQALLLAWATLAIYFSNLPWASSRLVLAVAFAAFGIWALWFARRPRFVAAFAVLFVGVLAWWSNIPPSHDRSWRADVAVMPRASIDGDRVRLTGVRNFAYDSRDDFTRRYESREVLISDLVAVDFYISYWMPGPVGHTFLSFVFDSALPLSISIEVRPEITEGYSPIASLFKQFELIYVVGDERDIVGVRTNHRGEDVYLYRIRTTREAARELFLVYMDRINQLAEQPEFYHLLSNSCTINIVRYASTIGRPLPFDLRHYLNGLADRSLYREGRLNTQLPFEKLRRRSLVNELAKSAGSSPDFSERIRVSLPVEMP